LHPIDGNEITGNQPCYGVAQERDKSRPNVVNAARSATILASFSLTGGHYRSIDTMGVFEIRHEEPLRFIHLTIS
jgi:hypothetical protein